MPPPKPSFEKIEYSLRPAKNVERKMMCEALSRLSRISKLKDYRYIGMGSIGFYDFSLFHQRLGINKMVSIEKEEARKDRFLNNRPYSCIEIRWGDTKEVLPTLDLKKGRSIVWLDYDKYISKDQINDVSHLASTLPSGSSIIVTLPADADDGEQPDHEAPKKRLGKLTATLGDVLLRPGLKPADLTRWGFAKVCRDVLSDKVQKTLNDRNAGLPDSEKLKFMQIFNFGYRDGRQMMTFGGVLLDSADQIRVQRKHFTDLEFVRLGEEQFLIEPPILTHREIRHLETLLPGTSGFTPPRWIPFEDRKRYKKIYRYFPTFAEVAS